MRPFFNTREAAAAADADAMPSMAGMRAVLHCVVLIVSFVLVSLLFAHEHAGLQRAAFAIAPPETPSSFIETLRGVAPLVASPALGLFSEVNPAVLCLCAQALAVAFHLNARSPKPRWDSAEAEDDEEEEGTRQAHWFLRKLSFGVLVCTAGLLLFMSERWRIPQNNLLLLELLLAVAFFFTGSNHHPHPHEMREAMLSAAFVLPLLCVASLAAMGEADVLALLISYASLGSLLLLWCLLDHFQCAAMEEEQDVTVVLRLTMWLCAVPFGFYASLRLSSSSAPGWATAGLGLGLGWVVILLLYFTFSLDYREPLIWGQQGVLVAMGLCLQIGLLLSSSSAVG